MRDSARASYGTGDCLKLNKRACGISIELIPFNCHILKIRFQIENSIHVFFASSAVGFQFCSFLAAVYQLYSEGLDDHRADLIISKYLVDFPKDDPALKNDEIAVQSIVNFYGEGPQYTITLRRKCKHRKDPVSYGEDPVEIIIESTRDKTAHYLTDGRDLCYAVAKAYTEALKKYGFRGYYSSTGGLCQGYGDAVDINMLLFVKAYALNALDVRSLKTVSRGSRNRKRSKSTSINKEMELLLFDM